MPSGKPLDDCRSLLRPGKRITDQSRRNRRSRELAETTLVESA